MQSINARRKKKENIHENDRTPFLFVQLTDLFSMYVEVNGPYFMQASTPLMFPDGQRT